jgi:hypothetical protein
VPVTPCTTDRIPTTAAMDWLNRIDLYLDPAAGVEKKLRVETSLALNYGFRSNLEDTYLYLPVAT